jgi:AAA domain-containing protein
LTAIGQNLSIEQWYDGLISRLGQQLKLEDELLDFWQAHTDWGPLQRWTSALEQVVLKNLSTEVVIFVDEIDIVRSLPFSTDEFFAAIRECHNRRAHEPAFNRLAFGLLGVASPTDLIRDTRMTPFNIGRRIELHDFTAHEAAPLATGLGADAETARGLLARVLYWTGGHPYLTQRLCRVLADKAYGQRRSEATGDALAPPVLPTTKDVDALAEKLFLSRQARDRDDNLIFVRERILRSEVDVAGLLYLYRRIHSGELVADDETNSLVSILHLSGIARGVNGYLQVRNRIYRQVFDLGWVQTNMPAAEVRRARKAGRRGMVLGFGSAAILLIGYLVVRPMWKTYHEATLARETGQRVDALYHTLPSYRDEFETTLEIVMGGVSVPIKGSGSVIFDRPNRVSLAMKSDYLSPQIEVKMFNEGNRSIVYVPSLNQYRLSPSFRPHSGFEMPAAVASQIGPITILPLYRLLLDPGPGPRPWGVRTTLPAGYGEIDGQRVRIVQWEHDAVPFLRQIGVTNPGPNDLRIPVTAWVNVSNSFVLQLRIDLSKWAPEILGNRADIPISGLTVTELHRSIQTKPVSMPPSHSFGIPSDAVEVDKLALPPPNFASLTSQQREFERMIPPRLPQTPPNLIDLSEYYNAAFAQTWHPGLNNNNLEMLPPGLLQLGGTVFDARGIVQVAGKRLQNTSARYPERITGIRIGQRCRHLQFLHGAGWSTRDGVVLGNYLLHYANGHEETIPIVYGEDVRDWNAGADVSTSLSRGRVVWRAVNDAHLSVRLFQTTWINPLPDVVITSIDYISAMADPAPFLIAITAE